MKLNYWIKPHNTDKSKSLRARTKGEVEIAFAKGEGAGKFNVDEFGASRKVTVEYKDGYDLMTQLRDGTLSEVAVVGVDPKSTTGAPSAPVVAATADVKTVQNAAPGTVEPVASSDPKAAA